ncbi:MAG: excinuclease ABC subunit UvrC [Planctomycetes bacterium]|nr:excinuclease ABC subunit UvrC [Planctomycetota bacterium]
MKSKAAKKTGELPEQPGVYLMKDRRKRVIYVGKARNIRQRVSNYYHSAAQSDPKTAALMRQVKSIDYLATDSEVDALLLEAHLVRDIKPKYNIQLKDDKSFPLIGVCRSTERSRRSRSDDFPRVIITRQRGNKDIDYYGPFISTGDLRSGLNSLQKIFKFRTCKLSIKEKNPIQKPCLLYHINRCVAPCIGKISKKDYKDIISLLDEFLSGNKKKVLRRLSKKMEEASALRDFEHAAEYRDRINALKGITTEGRMGEFYEGALAAINPSERLKNLQSLLGLDKPPRKIEGIDISDIKGNEAVGALVTFIDAEPFKNGYRKYKIKTVAEGEADDYARMREVIRRRLFDTENELPDILLIDGGKGHLSITEKVFAEEKISPPLIVGLSKHKGDHIVTNDKAPKVITPKLLTKYAAGFKLLQYIRDEAHRFAQKYHHYLREKRTYK